MSSIYLASQSPRRKEILDLLGVNFEILKCNFKEEILPNESALEFVERNTKEKALNSLAIIQAKREIQRELQNSKTNSSKKRKNYSCHYCRYSGILR